MNRATPRNRRLALIRELLQHHRVQNQNDLLRLLSRENIDATQATLSRDLRSLGVLKGPEGYTLGAAGQQPSAIPTESAALAESLRNFMLWARQAGTLVVVRTGPGRAPALALELDNALPHGAIGTIAGDDTIFLAAVSASAASRITRSMQALQNRDDTVRHAAPERRRLAAQLT